MFQGILAVTLTVGMAIVGDQTFRHGVWLGVIPLVIVAWRAARRPLRRWRWSRQPFPAHWRAWIERHVRLYRALEAAEKRRFERDVTFFMHEQTFEALQGVTVTDLHQVAVAAGAALLLQGRPDWELPSNRTILFYPDRFDDDYYDSDYANLDGMVHAQGPVILSVPAVEASWANPNDGSNVVLHELAHLFDFKDAHAEGVPSLMDPKSADAWSKLVRREMHRARLGKSLLRRYAATNPAELFAVAVENFFERPTLMAKRHEELYAALQAFFNVDPRRGVSDETNSVSDAVADTTRR